MSHCRRLYHLVWATRDRIPRIDQHGARVMDQAFRIVCRDEGVVVHAIGVMPDHVHLALAIPAQLSVSNLVRRMKSASIYAINHGPFLASKANFSWQPAYGVVAFGEASLERVVRYVTNQPKHHAADTTWPIYELTNSPYRASQSREST
jgi:putative transposase